LREGLGAAVGHCSRPASVIVNDDEGEFDRCVTGRERVCLPGACDSLGGE